MTLRLTRELVLERPERVSDGAGGYVTTWSVLGRHWAAIAPAKGRAATGGAGPLSRVPMTIVIRAFAVGRIERPSPGQRFVEGARRYAILAVSERDGAGRYLDVLAEEEVAL